MTYEEINYNKRNFGKEPGIYYCACVENEFCYVGQSVNVYTRVNHAHIPQLRGNRHRNIHMQHSWNKYGEDSFRWAILEYCPEEMLNEREEYWIKTLNTRHPYGFNLTTGGDNLYQRSDISRKRMSESWDETRKIEQSKRNKELWDSDEYRERLHESFVNAWTDERKERISARKKDIWAKMSEEDKDKIIRKIKANHADLSGSKNPHARTIQCLETLEVYNCIKDASDKLNINYSTLRKHLQGRSRHAGGLHFAYID